MRNLLALLVLLAMTGVSLHAQQDETPADRRSMTLYSCINSGHMTPDSDGGTRLFNSNCYVYGVTYNHVFGNIPWMTLHTRVNFKGDQSYEYSDLDKDGKNDHIVRSAYNSEVRGRFGLGFRIAPGLGASMNIDSRGVLYQSLDYSYSFGSAGSIAVGQELCARATPLSLADDGYQYITLLGFNIAYSVPLGDGWSFRSRLRPQLSGALDRLDVKNVEDMFRIRWENRISYNVTPKVNLWGTVRYEAKNIANDTDVENNVYLMAGFTYSFDVSGL